MRGFLDLLVQFHANRTPNKDESALGIGEAHCWLPRPSQVARYPSRVFASNPKYKMAAMDERACRPAKELLKLADGPRTDDIRTSSFRAKVLESFGTNLHISERKLTYNLRQECTLLLIGFNQCDVNGRMGNFERQARETSPSPNVGQSTVFHRQQFCSIDGFTKVARHNLNGGSDRSQIQSSIPLEQEKDVFANQCQLSVVRNYGKWGEAITYLLIAYLD
jgi:hypothetical protein